MCVWATSSEAGRVRRVAGLLRSAGMTLAVAESCTGGWLAKTLTDLPGSSGWFVGGVVAYANSLKTGLLGVDEGTLRRHGAVSEDVCAEMCWGVRRRTGSDVAVAVTGIAGPGGGSAAKPVGTVFIGVCFGDETVVHGFRFRGGRSSVRRAAVRQALRMVEEVLKGGLRT